MRKTLLPNNSEVRRLLDSALRHPDPRAALAISMMLWQSLTIGQLERIAWKQFDPGFGTLTVARGKRVSAHGLSPFLLALLHRIERNNLFLMSPPNATAPTVTTLFHSILCEASLSRFTANDFLEWSRAQTDAIRDSVIR